METSNPFSALTTDNVELPLNQPKDSTQSATTAVVNSEAPPPLEANQPLKGRALKRAQKRAAAKEEKAKNPPSETKPEEKPKSPKAAVKKAAPKEKVDKKSSPPPSKNAEPENKQEKVEKPPPTPKPSKTDRKLLEPFSPGKEITSHMLDVFKNVIKDLRATYVPIVPQAEAEWFKKIFGRDPEIDTTGSIHGMNLHEKLAILRRMALMDEVTYVLSYNPLKTLKERSIDFVYGTQSRDDAIMKTINIALAKAGFGTEKEPCILHHIVGEQLVPGDLTRRIGGFGVRSKIGVFMDVYAIGNFRMHPTTIAGMGYDLWIWAGHVFNGPYGAYAGAIWCREGIDFSQIWYKSDAAADAYAIHDACDIMHRAGKMTHGDTSVVWTSISKLYTREAGELIPVYNLVLGQNSDKEFLDLHSRLMQPIDVVMLKVKCPIVDTSFDFLNNTVTPWLASVGIYKTRTIPISSAIYSDLKQVCVARFYNQWTFAAVLTDVNKYFSNLEWFKKLETALPQKFVNYRYEVASSLYTELCEAKKQNLLVMNAVHGSDMHQANEQFKTIGTEPTKTSWTKKAIFFGAGLLMTYLAYKKAKQQTVAKPVAAIVDTINVIGFSYPRDPTPFKAQLLRLFNGLEEMKYIPFNVPILSDYLNKNIGQRLLAMPNYPMRMFTAGAYVSFIGPVIEESIKHLIPNPFIKSFISALFANLDFKEGSAVSLEKFLIAYIKHYLFSLLPLDTGIVLHSMLNLGSLIQGLYFPSFDSLFGDVNCIGLNPCLKAIFEKKTCEGRIIASPENFSSLSEFRIVSGANPLTLLHHVIIPFSPEKESFMSSSNCLPKFPKSLDATVKLRTPNISYDVLKLDTHTNDHDCGYYQIFAVSKMQHRPAANGYNTHMMLVNRLLKAPPNTVMLSQINSRFQLPYGDPSDVYDVNRRLESLFTNIMVKLVDMNPGIHKYRDYIGWFRYGGYDHTELARDVPLTQVLSRIESDEGFKEWLKHLHGIKQSMYRRYRLLFEGVEVNITSRCVTRIDVSIKSDETLLKVDWVPRPVHRVDPQFACYVGPHIYAASEEAKKIYWFFPIYYEGWVMTLTFGSSLNDEGLTKWMAFAKDDGYIFRRHPDLLLQEHHGVINVIVAGDDVLIVITQPKTFDVNIVEADVSQCDHSTRFAHLEFEWAFLRLFGVPDYIISLLKRNACAELRVRMPHMKNEYVTVERGYERNTGGTDTTIGNSTCIGHAWLAVIIDQLKRSKDSKIYIETWPNIMLKDYGFEMKVQQYVMNSACYESDTGTFLKGTWWHVLCDDDTISLRWGPLLSRLIKLSKVMTRPMSICRQNAPKSFPRHNHQATINELWYCMMAMVKAMEVFVWIPPVRQWFELLKLEYAEIAIAENLPPFDIVKSRHEDVAEYYKVKSSMNMQNIEVTMCPCWKERVAKRYKVSLDMIDNWSSHLMSVRPGSFSVHPFWEALASVDYC